MFPAIRSADVRYIRDIYQHITFFLMYYINYIDIANINLYYNIFIILLILYINNIIFNYILTLILIIILLY